MTTATLDLPCQNTDSPRFRRPSHRSDAEIYAATAPDSFFQGMMHAVQRVVGRRFINSLMSRTTCAGCMDPIPPGKPGRCCAQCQKATP